MFNPAQHSIKGLTDPMANKLAGDGKIAVWVSTTPTGAPEA